MTRLPTLWFGLCLAVQATPAFAPPVPHYRVSLDAYVIDELALCEHAWQLAVRDHGQHNAEGMVMTGDEFDAEKCLQVVFMKFHPAGVVTAGVEVKRQ